MQSPPSEVHHKLVKFPFKFDDNGARVVLRPLDPSQTLNLGMAARRFYPRADLFETHRALSI